MQIDDYRHLAIAATIALFGGIVSYIASNPREFSFKNLIIKGLSSGFVGLLIGLLSLQYELPEYMAFFLSGTFGYLGSEVTIALLKKFVITKIKNL